MKEAWLGDRDDPGGGLRQKLTHFEIPKEVPAQAVEP